MDADSYWFTEEYSFSLFQVKVQLNQLELSTKFLGASKEITLKEADVNLIGLILSKPASGKL